MQTTNNGGDHGPSAIEISVHLGRPAEDVWAAITEADRISAWWGDYVSLDARPGGAFREDWRDDDGREVITAGTIETFDPPHRLSLSWKDADWPVTTHVTIRIERQGNGARLTLVHDGWERFSSDGPALRQAHEAGWRHHLENLATLLGATRR